MKRKKGADLADGSDVKGANTWEAIDTPRFNGVLKAGTQADTAGRIESLDGVPYLFLVLWDHAPDRGHARCRIWCVRARHDVEFRRIGRAWYELRDEGAIKSNNFQLHPPRGLDSNVITNSCGDLAYPVFFCAERIDGCYRVIAYEPAVLKLGQCSPV